MPLPAATRSQHPRLNLEAPLPCCWTTRLAPVRSTQCFLGRVPRTRRMLARCFPVALIRLTPVPRTNLRALARGSARAPSSERCKPLRRGRWRHREPGTMKVTVRCARSSERVQQVAGHRGPASGIRSGTPGHEWGRGGRMQGNSRKIDRRQVHPSLVGLSGSRPRTLRYQRSHGTQPGRCFS